MISVIIPVRNGGALFERCLESIREQEIDLPVEIVVLDNASEDRSGEVARDHGARVEPVPAETFNPGAVRNAGVRMARGEILVFTSSDAHAERADWLRLLTAPLTDDARLAGVYGRQLPHPGAHPAEQFFLDYVYGAEPRVQAAPSRDEISMETSLFSFANGAIRREVWDRFPLAEDMVASEDQEWAVRALLDGWTLRYEPRAVVRHSHAYTIAAAFRRFFDSGVSAERAYLAGGRPAARILRSRALRYAREEVRWLIANGHARALPYTAIYELAKYVGLLLGTHHRILPTSLKRRFSLFPWLWDGALPTGR